MFNVPRRYRDIRRFEEILLVLMKNELGMLLEKLKLKKISMNSPEFDPNPERIRKVLEDLGGSFTKLGQLLSLRPDIIPYEYCKEFSKLQDSVKPFSGKEAEKIIKKELKKPVNKIFKNFSEKPIASASVGQVHKATLHSGEKVAVKVMRPHFEDTMAADIDILTYLASMVEKYMKPDVFSPTQIVTEFKDYSEKEMNYLKEASNIEKFYKNFKKTKTKIPKVFWKYCTERIIVMEYIEGIEGKKLIESNKEKDKKVVANKLANSILKQVFVHGFFHADPHPGNILVLERNEIAFLDFGIVGRVNDEMKEQLTMLFIAMIQANLNGMAKAMVNLHFVSKDANLSEFRDEIRDTFGQYYNSPLSDVNLSEVIHKGFEIAHRNNVKLPKNYVLLGKSVATMEGTCAELDPDFDIVQAAKPFVASLLRNKVKPSAVVKRLVKSSIEIKKFLEDVPEMSKQAFAALEKADEQLKKIDKDIVGVKKEVGNLASKIVLGFLAGCLIIGSALVAEIPQPYFHGYPAYSFVGLSIAVFLVLGIIVTWVKR